MDFQKLTDLLDSLNEKGIPACDCAVYFNHEPVYRHMSGFSDARKTKKVSNEDVYWLYSVTKVITCTAAMQLVEQGRIGLYDEARKYLPCLENMTVRDGDKIVPAKNVITIHDLFTMCAGFTYDLGTQNILETRKKTNNKATTKEMVAAIAKSPLSFEPSTHYQYSLCHDVLAAIIEVASDKTLGEYMQEHIFNPLGMKNTGFKLTPARKSHMSAQYNAKNDAEYNVEDIGLDNCYALSENYESGGAGLISCVDDYILFVDAMCNDGVGKNGNRIISRESIDLMRQNHLKGECYNDFCQLCKKGYSYGLGVRTLVDDTYSKSPVGEFGWDGAAGAYALIDPENHIAVFYAQHVKNCTLAFDCHTIIRDLTYKSLGL